MLLNSPQATVSARDTTTTGIQNEQKCGTLRPFFVVWHVGNILYFWRRCIKYTKLFNVVQFCVHITTQNTQSILYVSLHSTFIFVYIALIRPWFIFLFVVASFFTSKTWDSSACYATLLLTRKTYNWEWRCVLNHSRAIN